LISNKVKIAFYYSKKLVKIFWTHIFLY